MSDPSRAVIFRNPREIQKIARDINHRRLVALDIDDLVAAGPPKGMQGRLRDRLLTNLTDLSAENTARLRKIVSVPMPCGRWGESGYESSRPPLDRMLIRTAAAIMLVRLGIHPIAYALYGAITPLFITAGHVEIGNTLNQTRIGIEMLMSFGTPGRSVDWLPKPRMMTLQGVDMPDTMTTGLAGMPLSNLIRHPLADLVDVPIKSIEHRRSGDRTDAVVTCKVRVDEIRMGDIDPTALARADLRAI